MPYADKDLEKLESLKEDMWNILDKYYRYNNEYKDQIRLFNITEIRESIAKEIMRAFKPAGKISFQMQMDNKAIEFRIQEGKFYKNRCRNPLDTQKMIVQYFELINSISSKVNTKVRKYEKELYGALTSFTDYIITILPEVKTIFESETLEPIYHFPDGEKNVDTGNAYIDVYSLEIEKFSDFHKIIYTVPKVNGIQLSMIDSGDICDIFLHADKDNSENCILSKAIVEQLRPEIEQLIEQRKALATQYSLLIKNIHDKANEYLGKWINIENI